MRSTNLHNVAFWVFQSVHVNVIKQNNERLRFLVLGASHGHFRSKSTTICTPTPSVRAQKTLRQSNTHDAVNSVPTLP